MKRLSIIIAILIALSATACSKLNGDVTGNPTTPNSSGAATIAPSGDPREDLLKDMSEQLNARSFRARINSSGSLEGDKTWLVEFVAPDRYHMVMEATGSNSRMTGIEMIRVGTKIYMKSAERPWQEAPTDVSRFLSGFRDPKILDELRKSIDIKFIGPDTLDGIPMLVYHYTFVGDKPAEASGSSGTKVWVAATDGLPRKTESESEVGGRTRKLTSNFYDYNTDIKIEPPL